MKTQVLQVYNAIITTSRSTEYGNTGKVAISSFMKQFSEEENNLKCIKKNWWEIKLKLDMKTHLFCSKHLAKEKYLFECKWKGKACICSDYLICSLLTSPFKVIFFLLFLTLFT